MNKLTEEEMLSKIEDEQLIVGKEIPIELFGKRTSKTTQLVNNTDQENYLMGRSRPYEFTLEEPLYINSIVISTEKYSTHRVSRIIWEGPNTSGSNNSTMRISDDKFEFEINDFVSTFSFKPDTELWKHPNIKSVTLTGYTRTEFLELCLQISKLDEYKSGIMEEYQSIIDEANVCREEIERFEDQKEKIETQISGLNSESEEVETELTLLKDERSNIKSEISGLKQEETTIKTRTETLEDSIDQKKNKQKQLNNDISDKISELKSLKDKINMFPSEITGFVDQGARSIARYTFLAAVPILILIFVTYELFNSAVDLTAIRNTEEEYEVWTILLTKLPFVTVAAALIHACYKIAKIFIGEIIKINQQRLNLSKISIIATDVSSASSEGLGLDDNELYQHRTQLKMELLREHLKGYMPEDYSYEIKITPSNSLKNESNEEEIQIDEE
ncbi:MAG: hypothetical protein L3J50_10570 [Emcibacter sp.]|nr:hypothetical protein [Emcibacter sp.]